MAARVAEEPEPRMSESSSEAALERDRSTANSAQELAHSMLEVKPSELTRLTESGAAAAEPAAGADLCDVPASEPPPAPEEHASVSTPPQNEDAEEERDREASSEEPTEERSTDDQEAPPTIHSGTGERLIPEAPKPEQEHSDEDPRLGHDTKVPEAIEAAGDDRASGKEALDGGEASLHPESLLLRENQDTAISLTDDTPKEEATADDSSQQSAEGHRLQNEPEHDDPAPPIHETVEEDQLHKALDPTHLDSQVDDHHNPVESEHYVEESSKARDAGSPASQSSEQEEDGPSTTQPPDAQDTKEPPKSNDPGPDRTEALEDAHVEVAPQSQEREGEDLDSNLEAPSFGDGTTSDSSDSDQGDDANKDETSPRDPNAEAKGKENEEQDQEQHKEEQIAANEENPNLEEATQDATDSYTHKQNSVDVTETGDEGSNQDTAAEESMIGQIEKEKAQDVIVTENEVSIPEILNVETGEVHAVKANSEDVNISKRDNTELEESTEQTTHVHNDQEESKDAIVTQQKDSHLESSIAHDTANPSIEKEKSEDPIVREESIDQENVTEETTKACLEKENTPDILLTPEESSSEAALEHDRSPTDSAQELTDSMSEVKPLELTHLTQSEDENAAQGGSAAPNPVNETLQSDGPASEPPSAPEEHASVSTTQHKEDAGEQRDHEASSEAPTEVRSTDGQEAPPTILPETELLTQDSSRNADQLIPEDPKPEQEHSDEEPRLDHDTNVPEAIEEDDGTAKKEHLDGNEAPLHPESWLPNENQDTVISLADDTPKEEPTTDDSSQQSAEGQCLQNEPDNENPAPQIHEIVEEDHLHKAQDPNHPDSQVDDHHNPVESEHYVEESSKARDAGSPASQSSEQEEDGPPTAQPLDAQDTNEPPTSNDPSAECTKAPEDAHVEVAPQSHEGDSEVLDTHPEAPSFGDGTTSDSADADQGDDANKDESSPMEPDAEAKGDKNEGLAQEHHGEEQIVADQENPNLEEAAEKGTNSSAEKQNREDVIATEHESTDQENVTEETTKACLEKENTPDILLTPEESSSEAALEHDRSPTDSAQEQTDSMSEVKPLELTHLTQSEDENAAQGGSAAPNPVNETLQSDGPASEPPSAPEEHASVSTTQHKEDAGEQRDHEASSEAPTEVRSTDGQEAPPTILPETELLTQDSSRNADQLIPEDPKPEQEHSDEEPRLDHDTNVPEAIEEDDGTAKKEHLDGNEAPLHPESWLPNENQDTVISLADDTPKEEPTTDDSSQQSAEGQCLQNEPDNENPGPPIDEIVEEDHLHKAQDPNHPDSQVDDHHNPVESEHYVEESSKARDAGSPASQSSEQEEAGPPTAQPLDAQDTNEPPTSNDPSAECTKALEDAHVEVAPQSHEGDSEVLDTRPEAPSFGDGTTSDSADADQGDDVNKDESSPREPNAEAKGDKNEGLAQEHHGEEQIVADQESPNQEEAAEKEANSYIDKQDGEDVTATENEGSNQETAAEDFTSGHLEKEKAEDAVVTENEADVQAVKENSEDVHTSKQDSSELEKLTEQATDVHVEQEESKDAIVTEQKDSNLERMADDTANLSIAKEKSEDTIVTEENTHQENLTEETTNVCLEKENSPDIVVEQESSSEAALEHDRSPTNSAQELTDSMPEEKPSAPTELTQSEEENDAHRGPAVTNAATETFPSDGPASELPPAPEDSVSDSTTPHKEEDKDQRDQEPSLQEPIEQGRTYDQQSPRTSCSETEFLVQGTSRNGNQLILDAPNPEHHHSDADPTQDEDTKFPKAINDDEEFAEKETLNGDDVPLLLNDDKDTTIPLPDDTAKEEAKTDESSFRTDEFPQQSAEGKCLLNEPEHENPAPPIHEIVEEDQLHKAMDSNHPDSQVDDHHNPVESEHYVEESSKARDAGSPASQSSEQEEDGPSTTQPPDAQDTKEPPKSNNPGPDRTEALEDAHVEVAPQSQEREGEDLDSNLEAPSFGDGTTSDSSDSDQGDDANKDETSPRDPNAEAKGKENEEQDQEQHKEEQIAANEENPNLEEATQDATDSYTHKQNSVDVTETGDEGSNQDTAAEESMIGQIEKEKAQDVIVTENEVSIPEILNVETGEVHAVKANSEDVNISKRDNTELEESTEQTTHVHNDQEESKDAIVTQQKDSHLESSIAHDTANPSIEKEKSEDPIVREESIDQENVTEETTKACLEKENTPDILLTPEESSSEAALEHDRSPTDSAQELTDSMSEVKPLELTHLTQSEDENAAQGGSAAPNPVNETLQSDGPASEPPSAPEEHASVSTTQHKEDAGEQRDHEASSEAPTEVRSTDGQEAPPTILPETELLTQDSSRNADQLIPEDPKPEQEHSDEEPRLDHDTNVPEAIEEDDGTAKKEHLDGNEAPLHPESWLPNENQDTVISLADDTPKEEPTTDDSSQQSAEGQCLQNEPDNENPAPQIHEIVEEDHLHKAQDPNHPDSQVDDHHNPVESEHYVEESSKARDAGSPASQSSEQEEDGPPTAQPLDAQDTNEPPTSNDPSAECTKAPEDAHVEVAPQSHEGDSEVLDTHPEAPSFGDGTTSDSADADQGDDANKDESSPMEPDAEAKGDKNEGLAQEHHGEEQIVADQENPNLEEAAEKGTNSSAEKQNREDVIATEHEGSNQETAAEDFTSGHLEKEKAEDAVVTENEADVQAVKENSEDVHTSKQDSSELEKLTEQATDVHVEQEESKDAIVTEQKDSNLERMADDTANLSIAKEKSEDTIVTEENTHQENLTEETTNVCLEKENSPDIVVEQESSSEAALEHDRSPTNSAQELTDSMPEEKPSAPTELTQSEEENDAHRGPAVTNAATETFPSDGPASELPPAPEDSVSDSTTPHKEEDKDQRDQEPSLQEPIEQGRTYDQQSPRKNCSETEFLVQGTLRNGDQLILDAPNPEHQHSDEDPRLDQDTKVPEAIDDDGETSGKDALDGDEASLHPENLLLKENQDTISLANDTPEEATTDESNYRRYDIPQQSAEGNWLQNQPENENPAPPIHEIVEEDPLPIARDSCHADTQIEDHRETVESNYYVEERSKIRDAGSQASWSNEQEEGQPATTQPPATQDTNEPPHSNDPGPGHTEALEDAHVEVAPQSHEGDSEVLDTHPGAPSFGDGTMTNGADSDQGDDGNRDESSPRVPNAEAEGEKNEGQNQGPHGEEKIVVDQENPNLEEETQEATNSYTEKKYGEDVTATEHKDSNQDTAAAKSMSEQIEKEKAQDVVVAENEIQDTIDSETSAGHMQLQENQGKVEASSFQIIEKALGEPPEAEPVKAESVEHLEFHNGAEGKKSIEQTILKEKTTEAKEMELVSDPGREIQNVVEEKRRREDSCTGIDNDKLPELDTSQREENKQIGISHLPVSQLLTDRILREEGDKQCIGIKEEDARDGSGGADNTKQQENSGLSSGKQEKTEECTSQNPTEVFNDVTLILEDQSSDKQNSANNSDEGKPNKTDIVLPVSEMLINNAEKEGLMPEISHELPKDEKKNATLEKSKTKCETKNGEIINPAPMTKEKSDEAEVTEKRASFNANQNLHESPDTLLLAENANNKIFQEEGRQKFEETKEYHPNIEMLEKALTVDLTSETIVIETKKAEGSENSISSTQHPIQKSIPPVREVNQIPEASESAPEGKVRTQVDDKKGRISDENSTGEIPVEEAKELTSDKFYLLNFQNGSTNEGIYVPENTREEKNLPISKDESSEDVTHVQIEEEKSEEEEEERDEEEHNADKSGTDVSATIEMTEGEPKPAHKKSHNILSGVKSKVKHSIAKVKKAITGNPSQSKTMASK